MNSFPTSAALPESDFLWNLGLKRYYMEITIENSTFYWQAYHLISMLFGLSIYWLIGNDYNRSNRTKEMNTIQKTLHRYNCKVDMVLK